MDYVPDEIWRLFMPDVERQLNRIKGSNRRFSHYTTAESGLKILNSGRMLLRNSSMMNDFSEVQYGMNCLQNAYKGESGKKLRQIMRYVQTNLPEVFESNFDALMSDIRNETYLISVSEHGDDEAEDQLEDAFGRLSMWRAYAARNGIAFVFKNTPFIGESNVLNAFTSPVIYATSDGYLSYFDEIVSGIEANIDKIKTYGGAMFHEMIYETFRFAVQSTKHPSFREEREWRVIYSPTLLQRKGELTDNQMSKIPTEIMTISGVPQRVYALPFRNYEDEGFHGATIPELIDRVLIGPSVDAYAIAQAYVAELHKLNVESPADKVIITGIPLRV